MSARSVLLAALIILSMAKLGAQLPEQYKTGLNAEQNLAAIGKLNPNAAGGTGFDDRYQGVKGSPMLFDTLLSSLLQVKGMEEYLKLPTDIDAAGNNLVYLNPSTGKRLSIPARKVSDLFMEHGRQVFHFRTTEAFRFEKPPKDARFCQVLYDDNHTLIKIAEKIFVGADYKGAYTADRRYDEFKTEYKYYVAGPDSIFHQVNLSPKSLMKVFPGKKNEIDSFDEKNFKGTKEELIIAILQRL